jgi:hypothetical protein
MVGRLAVLAGLVACPGFSQTQSTVGPSGAYGPVARAIQGVVLSKSGAPVAGAVVLLKDTKTLQIRSFIAQGDGKYHFSGLSTDINYLVRAEFAGLTSPSKMVSVFDSKSVIVLNLKLTKKMKS